MLYVPVKYFSVMWEDFLSSWVEPVSVSTIPDKKANAPQQFSRYVLLLIQNFNCHEKLISDQILLKLECGVDE